MSENRFLQLLGKFMAGEATEPEINRLKELAESNSEWMVIFDELTQKEPAFEADADLKAEQAYALHSLKMQLFEESSQRENNIAIATKTKPRTSLLISGFVVLFLSISLGGYFLLSHSAKNQSLSEVVTKRGSRTNLTLPDGTLVWVNSETKIQYKDNLKGKFREVWLSGEAYFDVSHDQDHPFIIHTDKINIKVLGTAFNVKSYPNDPAIETSLIRGRIEVNFNDRPHENIILRPNEKLTVSTNQTGAGLAGKEKDSKIKLENLSPVNKDKLLAETAWLSNRLAFSDTRLADICNELQRKFNVEVEFKDRELMDYRYTGIFEEESLDQILQVMKISKPFNYNIHEKKLTLTL